MKKILCAIALTTVACTTAFAEGQKNDEAKHMVALDNKEIPASELRRMMDEVGQELTGGIIREANSAKGVFVVLNAQKRLPVSAYSKVVSSVIDKSVHVQMDFKSVDTTISVKNVRAEIVKAGGVLGVVVVDDADLPSLVTAPEDGWSLVNVASLFKDNPKEDILASRVRKEILRGLAFISGGAYLGRASFVMRDVKSVKDLDAMRKDAYGIEVAGRMRQSSGFYGLVPWHQASYKKACYEGWAPAPTNKYQQAIWDKAHAIPKNPMKIEFDPKKGR